MQSIEIFKLKLNAITITLQKKVLNAELNIIAEVHRDYLENLIIADV